MDLSPPRGSTLWLLAHELRLSLRAISSRRGGRRSLIIVALVMAALGAFGGYPLALRLMQLPAEPTAALISAIDTALAVIFTMVLSQTLSLATQAFFERGDLELLLSSPLPPQRVLATRAVGIATAPFLWFTALASLPVVPLVAMGRPQWLAVYPVLAAIALLASSAGIGLTLLLFRLLGARRTREAGHALAALIGATFFLIIQARSLLPGNGEQVFGGLRRWARSGVFEPDAPLAWPARAVLGEPLPLLALGAFALLVFSGTAATLGRRFSANVAAAAGAAGASGQGSRRAVTTRGFSRSAFGAVLRKELRLLARDPTLLSQGLLRALYVVPLTFAMLQVGPAHPDGDLAAQLRFAALAGSVTFLAGQIAGALAMTCIISEDAPELLVCAPVEPSRVSRAKLAAVLIPTGGLLSIPILVLTGLSPWVGFCALAGGAASAGSAVAINLRLETPRARRAFHGRRDGSAVTAIGEILTAMGWAVATWLAASGSVWCLVPAGVVLAGLWALRFGGQDRPRRTATRSMAPAAEVL